MSSKCEIKQKLLARDAAANPSLRQKNAVAVMGRLSVANLAVVIFSKKH